MAPQAATQAKDHVRAGLAYAERGKWDEALREFEEGYALDPQLTTLFDVAQSRLQTKRYRGAADAYRRLLGSRAALSAAQLNAANQGLAMSNAHVGHLELRGVEPGDVVEVDGAAVDPKRPVDVDPGPHQVVAVRGGTRMPARAVTVPDGQRVVVTVVDRSAPDPAVTVTSDTTPAPPTAPPPPPSTSTSTSTSSEDRPVTGFVIGGLGLAAVGVGAVLGITALSKHGDLAGGCGTTKTCAQDDVDSARTRMAVADVTVGVGLVATAIGAYLVLTRPSSPVSVLAGPASGGAYAGLRTSFR